MNAKDELGYKVGALRQAKLGLSNLGSVWVDKDGKVHVPEGQRCTGRLECPTSGLAVIGWVGWVMKRWKLIEVGGREMGQMDEDLRLDAAANGGCEWKCPNYRWRQIG